ncbi:aspartate/glutamate racemase family protein [Lentzea sp. CC55]|uniref:aspartate/glutamate racemase family protein n=1 Tax=Lentzea sp. CC55 TaxID=2884909 RepID=UPI001F266603|nr:aspartate/glutamate racemase family protein [Lentzea sp. CC55]MCG8927609.1 aspartate/glutamate racemase family protein [Lentzea sp. CC55]
MTLIALVHATPAPIGPAAEAFADALPQARLWNLLDDTLIGDAEQAGGLTPALRTRMRTLIAYAVDHGADAVLLTCSMYGPVAEEAARNHPVPVLPSDLALFDEVARLEPATVLVLGPAEAGTRDTVDRLSAHLGPGTSVHGTAVAGVREALAENDVDLAARLLATSASAHLSDVVVLGQFSLAPAAEQVRALADVPVLSPPRLAAQAVGTALAGAKR